MQKTVRIVRVSQAYEQMPGADLDAKLASGDWLVVRPKPQKLSARRRVLRARLRAEGWTNLNLWVSAEQAAAIKAAQREGETVVELIIRLLINSKLTRQSLI